MRVDVTSPASVVALVLALAAAACESPRDRRDPVSTAGDLPSTLPADVQPSFELPARFHTIGRTATPAEVRAWDIDVNPAGRGLPSGGGRGTYERGATVFAQQCASCHGMRGEGMAANPKLIGREPRDFSFASDPRLAKTIGNYWPYATTLYDYINRAMPFTTPGSLPPADVYSVVAFLLAENEIIDRNAIVDSRTLPMIHMPARDRFVADDRLAVKTFR